MPPDRLTVLAFLHDFGKANRVFQARRGGHIAEAVPLLLDAELAEAAGLAASPTPLSIPGACSFHD